MRPKNHSIYLASRKVTGLTLLEVMVALFIFALTGTAIMKAAGEHLNSVGQIEQISFATWVANNRLTTLHIKPEWPPKNSERGSAEMAGRTWYWQQRTEKTNDKDMVKVEISVGLNEQYEDIITSVSSFIAKQEKT